MSCSPGGTLSIATAKKTSRKRSPRQSRTGPTRAQLDLQLYNLKLDINNLKQELRNLMLRREMIHTRSLYTHPNSPTSLMRTVSRYFHGFERGFRGIMHQPEQLALVHSISDESLSLGVTGLGVGMLLEQWRRYTATFHIRQTVVHSADVVASPSGSTSGALVKCTVELRGLLTRRAVDTIFPNAHRHPLVMLQALGREIKIPMIFHLYFNGAGHLVRHDVEADFFAAIRAALDGDTNAAARFIEDARVGEESMLGPVSTTPMQRSVGTADVRPSIQSTGETDLRSVHDDTAEPRARHSLAFLLSPH